MSTLTAKEIARITPRELITEISRQFNFEIPAMVDTVEDMKRAGELLSRFTSYYNYFTNMVLVMNTYKKEQRKAGRKDVADDAMDKEHILSEYAQISKSNYQAVSRMLTIRQQITEELKFSDGRVYDTGNRK